MQPNTHFTNGMIKYAGAIGSAVKGLSTGAYNLASGAVKGTGKALFTKIDPVTKNRRFAFKRTLATGAGLYAGKKILDETQNQSNKLSRNYMDDIHPYRQSDTLRVAR